MKTFLMLYSDTGGGHRAGAEAVAAALVELFPGEVDIHLVDGFVDQGTAVGRRIPGLFPYVIKYGRRLWDIGYRLSDTSLAESWFRNFPLTKNWETLLKLINPDVIVSYHSLLTAPAIRAVKSGNNRIPVFPVILDLRSIYAAWIATDAAAYFSPSPEASLFLHSRGIEPKNINELGLPLHPKFSKLGVTRGSPHSPLRVLVTGGGDGLGDLLGYLTALDKLSFPMKITVITGRNSRLKNRLKALRFNHPVEILGFVNNMEERVNDTDIVMAKAGPFSVMEAVTCLKPLLLYDFLPRLEEGNVEFVEEHRIGRLLKNPDQLDSAIRWIVESYDSIQGRLETLRHPQAAYDIAKQLMHYAN